MSTRDEIEKQLQRQLEKEGGERREMRDSFDGIRRAWGNSPGAGGTPDEPRSQKYSFIDDPDRKAFTGNFDRIPNIHHPRAEDEKKKDAKVISSARGTGGGARTKEEQQRMEELRKEVPETETQKKIKGMQRELAAIEKMGQGGSGDKQVTKRKNELLERMYELKHSQETSKKKRGIKKSKKISEKKYKKTAKKSSQKQTGEKRTKIENARDSYLDLVNKKSFPSGKDPRVRELFTAYDFSEEELDANSGVELAQMFKERIGQKPDSSEASPTSSMEVSNEELERENEALKLFNTNVEEVREHVEGFGKLPHGKRMLIIENLRKISLGEIEEQGSKAGNTADTRNASWIRRIGRAIVHAEERKRVQGERKAAQEILSGGIEKHKDLLQKMVNGAYEMPNARETEDGTLEIEFIDTSRFTNESERRTAEQFNTVATELTHMPTEWKHDAQHWQQMINRGAAKGLRGWLHKPSRENYEKYHELKARYNTARENMLRIAKNREGEQHGMAHMNEIDAQISTHQHLNTHPDAERALISIRDDSMWDRVYKKLITERGMQLLAGGVVRSISTTMGGVFGGALAGSLIGGFNARTRAWANLKEADLAALNTEYSQEEFAQKRHERKTAWNKGERGPEKNIVGADILIEKLERDIDRAQLAIYADIGNDPAAQKTLASLQARLGFTRRKLDEGLVNFGKSADALDRQYRLTQALGHGFTQAEALASFVVQNPDISNTAKDTAQNRIVALQEKINSVLDIRAARIDESRRAYVSKQIRDQALVGAGFGVAGSLIMGQTPKWFGWEEPVVRYGSTSDISPDNAGMPGYPSEELQNYTPTRPPAGLDAPDVPHYADDVHPPQETPHYASDIHPATETESARDSEYPGKRAEMVTGSTDPTVAANMEVTVGSGGTLWGAIESKLQSQGVFQNMDEGQRTYTIDKIKDAFAEMSTQEIRQEVGIESGNIDQIKAGETISLASVMERAGFVTEAAQEARALSAEATRRIVEHNEKIAEWVESHPNEPLTPEKTIEILHDDIEETLSGKTSDANAVQPATTQQPESQAQPETTQANTGDGIPLIGQEQVEQETQQGRAVDASSSTQESYTRNIDPDSPEGQKILEEKDAFQERVEAATQEQRINTRIENDVNRIFETNRGLDSEAWKSLSPVKMSFFLGIEPGTTFTGQDEPIGKMYEYINTIQQETNIQPQPQERVADYINRALTNKYQ